MALGTRVFKIHSVSRFTMILSLGNLGLKWNKSQFIVDIFENFIKYFYGVSYPINLSI